MSLRLWLLDVNRYHCYSYCQTSKCDCGDYGRDDNEHIIITITILIIIVVTIIARQEEEAECDRHEFIAVSYTAPALALDEDDDKDLDYSNDVVSTFEHCCHHHVADELILFLYSHLSFFTLTEPCDFSWQTKHSSCLVIYEKR